MVAILQASASSASLAMAMARRETVQSAAPRPACPSPSPLIRLLAPGAGLGPPTPAGSVISFPPCPGVVDRPRSLLFVREHTTSGSFSLAFSPPSMSIGILGKKLGMSQFFDDEGRSIPVTLIEAGPCRITQLKSPATDGYSAVQLGYGDIRPKLVNKPAQGHLARSGEEPLRHLREVRVATLDGFELGATITVADFEAGQKVDVRGDTIGRGFAGYQKRHGFSRGPMTHGSKNHREPGSTGAGTTPGRVYPGKRMAGRYGGKPVTTRGLTILKVDADRNLLVVKGSVPGKPGALLDIRPALRVGSQAAT